MAKPQLWTKINCIMRKTLYCSKNRYTNFSEKGFQEHVLKDWRKGLARDGNEKF